MPAHKCLKWPLAAENFSALFSSPCHLLDHSRKGNGKTQLPGSELTPEVHRDEFVFWS